MYQKNKTKELYILLQIWKTEEAPNFLCGERHAARHKATPILQSCELLRTSKSKDLETRAEKLKF
jgi:hypothetical protein